ncbi:hypothetical protein BY458DRAFT_460380 [Sporodiniella umbellata]|nr:hypothetical protein BY458DRAFT_460380 [Sporodiniella umbellata]
MSTTTNLQTISSPTPSTNRLSQVFAERIQHASVRHKTHSPPSSPPLNEPLNQLSIDFDGNTQLILRPNRIIRGHVCLVVTKAVLATQIRIKFRAEETAMAKVREYGLESKIERIDQVTTNYFDVEAKVWGKGINAYSMASWETIEPGDYRYEFALKLPNVNFPPSTDDPVGFSMRYIWSAHLDGAGFNPGLRSKDYMIPYRPIIAAPAPEPWSFTQTLQNEKRTVMGHVTSFVPRQAFCPDEDVDMTLAIDCVSEDWIVSGMSYSLFKHNEGQIQLQRGLARKSKTREILHSIASVPGNAGHVRVPIHFHIPTRLVSPSFQSRHINVYYDILFSVQFSNAGSLLKSSVTCEFALPIGITNLPYNHLLHIQHLTSVQSYQTSKASPVFFDPALEEPRLDWSHHATPPITSPPSYFSINDLPYQSQLLQEREEKTHYTSRLIKPGMSPELGDPIVIVSEHKDYEW